MGFRLPRIAGRAPLETFREIGFMKRLLVVVFAALIAASPSAAPPAHVQVGYCTNLKNLEAAKAAGFDYVEVAATEIAALSDADFDAAAAHIKTVGIATPTANLFLPATLKVTGPQIDVDAQTAHMRKVFTRLERLGVQILVFGSGGARRVPEGFSKDEAFKQLVDFGRRAAQEARSHHITVTIEPLRKQETNIINTAAEGLELVNAIDDPNFQLMIDFYHLATEHEDPSIVVRGKDHLRHLHMANPQGRVFPLKWEEYDYAPFFEKLREIGYDRRISVEALTKDLAAEGPQAIALLRRAFER
jgi:D-psicose/D-tagatose/L-ribulose 3-epimerase